MLTVTLNPLKEYKLEVRLPEDWKLNTNPPGYISTTRCFLQITPTPDTPVWQSHVDIHENSGKLQISYASSSRPLVHILDSEGKLLGQSQSLNVEKFLLIQHVGPYMEIFVDPIES